MQNLNNGRGVPGAPLNSSPNFSRSKLPSVNSKNVITTILSITAVIFVVMFCYEFLEQWLFPNVTLWQSHLINIILSTVIASIASFIALRRHKVLHEKTLVEAEELRRIQNALSESENRFYELFDNANDIVYTTDLVGNFTSLNKAGEQVSGFSRDEALKMNIAQVVATDYLELARKMMQHKIDGLGATVYELQIITKDNRRLSLEVSTRIVECDGKAIGIQGIARTTRKQTEEALEEALYESEARFRAVTETARDAIIIINQKSEILFANAVTEKKFGYKISELIGQNVTLLTPERLQKRYSGGIEKFYETGVKNLDRNTIKIIGLRNDGSEFPFEISFSEFEIEGERFLTGIIRDITERKEAERALRESEEQFRSFYENAPLGIYRTTPDGRVLMANPMILRMVDFTLEEMQARNLNDENIEVKPKRSWFKEKIERDGEIKGLETVWLKCDGTTVFVRENARCVRAADNSVLYYEGTVEDITERKQLEDQLRQSQKMDAVGQLAGGVAHDFNNILTIINGYSDLTLRRLPANDPLRQNLEEVIKAGDRAAALTKQLLAFSRKQILAPKILNLNLVAANMDKMLRRLIGEDIDFVTSLEPDLGSVEADRGQIEQVILNLVVNARDAMPTGGKLTLETATIYVDEIFAQIDKAEQPGQFVMIAVSDTGIGMDAVTREHVFEPFYTTKETGTGLGLSTVYGIVKQSGGHTKVYSEKGFGTTFKIYLPLVADKVQNPQDLIVPANEMSGFLGGFESILLVEDEEAVRELIKDVLETNGYKVLVPKTPQEALEICKGYDQEIQLLLTDVVMPQMSGRELVEKAVKLHPEMKILYMSGYTNTAIVHHGVLDEGTHFIQKPFAPKSLVQKVRETLDGKA